MNHTEFQEQIWEAVRGLAGRMDAIFSHCSENLGLTVGQLRAMFLLSMEQRMTVSVLSTRLGIAPGNLSPLCKKMEGMGLMERQRSQTDERVVEVSLTERGREIVSDVRRRMAECCDGALSELTSEDMEQILHGIRKMESVLINIRTNG